VAIIGAGFTGLSAGLHLAQAGTKVTIIEGTDIGFGGSGRNAGLVNAGLWLAPDDVVSVLGEARGRAIQVPQPEFRRCGLVRRLWPYKAFSSFTQSSDESLKSAVICCRSQRWRASR
jgi:glycine/D-amino acid oxidase-like deaminating enzyme